MGGASKRGRAVRWIAVMVGVVGMSLYAQTLLATIVTSSHDFTVLTGGSQFKSDNEDEVCIFCHTPHNASGVPLWNKNLDATGYTMYNSDTFTASPKPTAPTGVSLLCMSCHDGISAINVVVNYGRHNPIVMNANYDQLGDLSYPPWSDPNLTKDLSDDHPISFVYDSSLASTDGGLHDPTVVNIAPLKLFNSRVECATCHDPHEEGSQVAGTFPFLRKSNQGSDMCLTCHDK